jgi:hypothetical protein
VVRLQFLDGDLPRSAFDDFAEKRKYSIFKKKKWNAILDKPLRAFCNQENMAFFLKQEFGMAPTIGPVGTKYRTTKDMSGYTVCLSSLRP